MQITYIFAGETKTGWYGSTENLQKLKNID